MSYLRGGSCKSNYLVHGGGGGDREGCVGVNCLTIHNVTVMVSYFVIQCVS